MYLLKSMTNIKTWFDVRANGNGHLQLPNSTTVCEICKCYSWLLCNGDNGWRRKHDLYILNIFVEKDIWIFSILKKEKNESYLNLCTKLCFSFRLSVILFLVSFILTFLTLIQLSHSVQPDSDCVQQGCTVPYPFLFQSLILACFSTAPVLVHSKMHPGFIRSS